MNDLILNKETINDFLEKVMEIIKIGVDFKLKDKVLNYATPGQIAEIFEKMDISKEGVPIDRLLSDFENISDYSINFSSRNFMAQPDAGNSIAGILAEIGRIFLQQNTVNFDYSPAATILEIELLNFLRSVIGYECVPNPENLAVKAGGAFTFGGYGSNLSCMLIAREKLKEKLRKQGNIYDPRRTRVLANQRFAHYSLRRSLDILGIGNKDLTEEQLKDMNLESEPLVNVKSKNYKMDIYDLECKINHIKERGEDIAFIFAISGESRAMGFDNLDAVVKIAQKYDIWVHVDACQGGQCLFSRKLRALLNGIENADSVALDPHKIMMIPYNLSAFFVKRHEDLYLLPKGSTIINNEDDSLGKFTPGIGSKGFISLKLWFMLRNWGLERIEEEIERRHELALKTAELVSKDEELVLLNPNPEHNAVLLMYRPSNLDLDMQDLNDLNQKIHQKLTEEGNYYLHTFPTFDDAEVFGADKNIQLKPLRFMFGNPVTTIDDVASCLEAVKRIGRELAGV